MAKDKSHLMQVTPEMTKQADLKMDEFTRELIDMDTTALCKKLEILPIGELKVIRLYLDDKLAEVNTLCSEALNTTLRVSYSMDELHLVIPLFVVLAKIEAKKGILDFFLMKKQIG